MKRSGRVRFPWPALLALFLAAPAAFAATGWDFTPAGDPNRNWGASVNTFVGYDDNFNATENKPLLGARVGSDIKLRATVPIDRLFLAGTYDYQIISSRPEVFQGVDLSHNVNLSANYVASPRLTFGLTENFISTLQPGAVLTPNGQSVTLVDAGQYTYDAVSGTMNYSLTERWSVSLSGSWDIWQYQELFYATNDDHQDYSATVSAFYALDNRTTVGLNYQWGQNLYVNPGPGAGLDADSHSLYLSIVRRFNPQLAATLNAGYTVRYSENGTNNSSPTAYGQLTYNYGPASTLSLTLGESLSASSLGVNRQFGAQQNSSVAIDLNHQVSVRSHALADLTYQYSTFTAQVATQSSTGATTSVTSPNDQSLTLHLGLNYAYRAWGSIVLDYYFTRQLSADPGLVQPYIRDQINLGTTLTY